MEWNSGVLIVVVLMSALLVPFLVNEIRKGKKFGRTAKTWCKPQGHTDVGPDSGRGPGGRDIAVGTSGTPDDCAAAPASMSEHPSHTR